MDVDIKTFRDAVRHIGERQKQLGAEALNDAARIILDEAKASAPQGPTGNLKKSITFKVQASDRQKRLFALVKVNRKIAPHAHLVEAGTKGARVRKKGSAKAYKMPDGNFIAPQAGQEITIGAMPASRFFRKGVAKGKKQFVSKLKARLTAGALASGL